MKKQLTTYTSMQPGPMNTGQYFTPEKLNVNSSNIYFLKHTEKFEFDRLIVYTKKT